MFDKELFESDPRAYVLEIFDHHLVSEEYLITALLKYMSHDDVRGALDANELSPRFYEDE